MRKRIQETFDSIHAEEELKRNTQLYVTEQMQTYRPRASVSMRFALPALCTLFLLFGLGGYRFYTTPVAVISVDINPSVELGVNPLDRIISTTPYNEDGAKIIKDLKLKHRKYEDALNTLLENEELEKYLEKEDFVSISVTSKDNRKNTEIQDTIKTCTEKQKGMIHCHTGEMKDMEAAHEAGLSFGKYRAFLELQNLDPEITPKKVQGMSMRQIQDCIDSHTVSDGQESENSHQPDRKKHMNQTAPSDNEAHNAAHQKKHSRMRNGKQ